MRPPHKPRGLRLGLLLLRVWCPPFPASLPLTLPSCTHSARTQTVLLILGGWAVVIKGATSYFGK